jgi:aminopeptidase YwaD
MPKLLVFALLAVASASAQTEQYATLLLSKPVVSALADETSGETAKRNLEFISTQHRVRGSKPFRLAAEHVAAKLREYGLSDVKIEELPADGKIFYGTQRSRPAWDAEFAQLWEVQQKDGKSVPIQKLADWDAVPLSLAEDSESGDTEGELIDVGPGTSDKDYAGKDVRGKYVLVAAQGEPVVPLAIAKYGAVGIVSYAQNQPTAWSGDNPDQIRWGHLATFTPTKAFTFQVSLRRARELQARLNAGEHIRLHGVVRAGNHPGAYSIATASIPGTDPALRSQEIVLTCHLDHPRPGANDNISGCVTILEVARTLAKLIRENKIATPARTIRFLWPMEVEGSIAYLNAHPDWAKNVKADIHLDMVGGSPETKAVFHVTRGPASVPSFINDIAESIAEWVNDQTYQFAATGESEFPLIAQDGGKEPLRAELVPFTMGSDHEVFSDSSWRIPTIYMNDWPDRNIHTNFDTAAMIDTTKLKRAAFIAAASAYQLATLKASDADGVLATIRERSVARTAETLRRGRQLAEPDRTMAQIFRAWYEDAVVGSTSSFSTLPDKTKTDALVFVKSLNSLMPIGAYRPLQPSGDAGIVFRRKPEPKGPMTGFGYEYLADKLGEERTAKLRLPKYQGLWGGGEEYAYEALNFVDGKRNVQQVRDFLTATYGPVPIDAVAEYLQALASIGVLERVQ